MARHESEMHRERRELRFERANLLEALRDIAALSSDPASRARALAAIKSVQPPRITPEQYAAMVAQEAKE